MPTHVGYTEHIETNGFAVVPNVLDKTVIARLISAIESAIDTHEKSHSVRRKRDVYAIRNLIDVVPELHGLQQAPSIRRLVEPLLGINAVLVRAILFDKTEQSNWGVFWHQDLSIAVRERAEVAGFERWSTKAGVNHVQPPPEILEQMLALRLHLDDCDESNGALRVIPGSHRQGRLSSDAVDEWKSKNTDVLCEVAAGGIVLMRPLLLHSSPKMTIAAHRRVLHLEFSGCNLPSPLEWAQRDPIATAIKPPHE